MLHQLQLQQERLVLDTETYLDEHLIQHLRKFRRRVRPRCRRSHSRFNDAGILAVGAVGGGRPSPSPGYALMARRRGGHWARPRKGEARLTTASIVHHRFWVETSSTDAAGTTVSGVPGVTHAGPGSRTPRRRSAGRGSGRASMRIVLALSGGYTERSAGPGSGDREGVRAARSTGHGGRRGRRRPPPRGGGARPA